VNGELGRTGREVVVAYLKHNTCSRLKGVREFIKHVSISGYTGRDSNFALPEHSSEASSLV
jgi:hypothetical protein